MVTDGGPRATAVATGDWHVAVCAEVEFDAGTHALRF